MFLDNFTWGLYTIVTLFTIYLILTKGDYIKEHKKGVILFVLGLLLYSLYIRYFDRLFTTNFSYDIGDIPKGYCRVSVIVTAIYLITRNKRVGLFLFFQTGFGFFSVIFPGGDFFVLTQSHHNFGYIYDHFVLAIMPFFLVIILGITPTKKAMLISLAYSIIIPFALLPYAISTGDNAYYILDGVFIKDVFGSNQITISIVYLFGITIYHYVMFLLGKLLIYVRNKNASVNPLFKPAHPWIIVSSYLIIGIVISAFFVNNVPSVVTDLTDTYEKNPVKQLDDFAYIFEGTKDGETIFFIEIVKKYEEVVLMDEDGLMITVDSEDGVFYYSQQDVGTDSVIILLYKNRDEENEKVKAYSFGN